MAKKQYNIYLDEEYLKGLERLARQQSLDKDTRITVSDIVKEALDAYLKDIKR